jgi:hypothetical protein
MWFEIKVIISGVAILFIVVVLAFCILYGMILFSFLLFIAMALVIFSDIIFGHVYTTSRGKYWVDKPPAHKRLIILHTLDNIIDLDWWDKGPYGKREGIYNQQEASLIDRGNYPVAIPNGARGFIAHEKSEKNINLDEIEYAEILHKEFKTDNVKEMYIIAKDEEKTDAKE